IGAKTGRYRRLLERLAAVRVTAEQADRLEAHHRLTATLIEAAPDSRVDVCVGRVSVPEECILDILPFVRVAAPEAEVDEPRTRGCGEAEDTEAREARPARELRRPLMPVKGDRVGRRVLRRGESGREREDQGNRQAKSEQSGLRVGARRLTIHGSLQTASAPPSHCVATRPASATPTTTLAAALPRCSSVAQRAPRVEASRTTLASETDTASIPAIVPIANATKYASWASRVGAAATSNTRIAALPARPCSKPNPSERRASPSGWVCSCAVPWAWLWR